MQIDNPDRIIVHSARDLPRLKTWLEERSFNKICTDSMDKRSNRLIILLHVHEDGFKAKAGLIVVLNQNHHNIAKAKELSIELFDKCLDVVYDAEPPEEVTAPKEEPRTTLGDLAPQLSEARNKMEEIARRTLVVWREAPVTNQAVVWAMRNLSEPSFIEEFVCTNHQISEYLQEHGFWLNVDSVLSALKKIGLVEHVGRNQWRLVKVIQEYAP